LERTVDEELNSI